MPRRVILSKAALSDQRRVEAWYSQTGSGAAGRTLLSRLDAAIRSLSETPLAHPVGPRPGSRLLVTQKHTVVYRVMPDRHGKPAGGDIVVLRIYGPGQAGT